MLPALPDAVQGALAVVLMSLDDGATGTLSYSMDAVAPFCDAQTYALRSVWAPTWATGPRELAAEAELI